MSNATPAPRKSAEEIKYDKMFSYFKWCVTVASFVIGAVGTTVFVFTYKDRKEMQEEYKTIVENLGNQARTEIATIELSANEIALRETKRKIDSIFETTKIKGLIEDVATKNVRNKVSQIIDKEIQASSDIDNAAASMSAGHISGMEKLKSFFKDSANSIYSQKALRLYNSICEDYYQSDYKYAGPYMFHITNNTVPESERTQLAEVINEINKKEQTLQNVSYLIIGLSANLDKKFKPFQIEEINEWYAGLKK